MGISISWLLSTISLNLQKSIVHQSVEALEYVHALVKLVGMFGVMESVRSDGGSQFTARVCESLSDLLGYRHMVTLPYHSEANGIVERRNREVMKHLRAIVFEKRVIDNWSIYLPLAQRIINASYDFSIGTYPARVLFGEVLPISSNLVVKIDKDIPVQPMKVYLNTLKEQSKVIMEASLAHLESENIKRKERRKTVEQGLGYEFKIGDYVLVTYPNRHLTNLVLFIVVL